MLTATLLLLAQQAPPPGGPVPADDASQAARPAAEAPTLRIAWYTDWEQALAIAQETNRPILLQSAAPQCGGVPGMW